MTKLLPVLITATLAACGGGGYYTGTIAVTATTPDLAYVAPGVSVIADYDAPIFYTNGTYWYYADGYWYRSRRYTGGWSYVASPPRALLRIERPRAYIRYRPRNYHAHRRPVPARQIERPVVRDHRDRDYRARDDVHIDRRRR